jgi:hypothetical protein
MDLTTLSSGRLVARLGELVSDERSIAIDFILHLAELERRRLHLELGAPSLFAYCTDRLRLTKGAAYRRTTCARLVTRFPAALDHLRDGRLCPTTLALLKDVLTDENHRAVLDRAGGKTETRCASCWSRSHLGPCSPISSAACLPRSSRRLPTCRRRVPRRRQRAWSRGPRSS